MIVNADFKEDIKNFVLSKLEINYLNNKLKIYPSLKDLEDKLNFSYLNETASSINKHIITIQNIKDNVERGSPPLPPFHPAKVS